MYAGWAYQSLDYHILACSQDLTNDDDSGFEVPSSIADLSSSQYSFKDHTYESLQLPTCTRCRYT